jgi:hypothetical protein
MRETRIPRAVHPWPEDEPERVARAITLGAALSLGAWTLVAVVVLLVLAVLA